jgi:deoxyhypusine synthase
MDKKDSLVQSTPENNVPLFCPAFIDSSAGLGLVKHRYQKQDSHIYIDSVRDFRELAEVEIGILA